MPGEERAARVLELVRGLTTEVHRHASRLTVTLDSQFDDLGIGSLELAELLLRVQNSFGMTLPSHILTSAETPRDLLRAVSHDGAPVVEDIGQASPVVTGAAGPAPVAASTLIDALEWHVGATPERTHIRILDESGSPDELTYGALHREAAAVAAGLLARDVMPGDTVANGLRAALRERPAHARSSDPFEGLVLLADHRPVGGQRDGGLPLALGGSPTATISAPHVHRYASPASGQWHSTSTRTRHAQSSWTHVSKVPGP
jgi:acyl carrier protein